MEEQTARMPFNKKLAAAARSEPAEVTSECLEPDEIIGLIEQGADSPTALRRMAHVATCAYCRQEFDAMEKTLGMAARAQRIQSAASPPAQARQDRPFLWRRLFAPSTFALGAAVAGFLLYWAAVRPLQTRSAALQVQVAQARAQMARQQQAQARQRAQTQEALRKRLAQQEREHAARMARARQENGQVQQTLQNLRTKNEEMRKRLASRPAPSTALEDGSIGGRAIKVLEAAMAEWFQPRNVAMVLGTERGGNDPVKSDPSLTGPVATFVLPTRPTLRWEPLEGATRYHVLVANVDDESDIQEKTVSGAQWTATRDLRRGAIYQWQVTANRAGKQLESPRVRFQVLDGEAAQRMARAKREYARHPLLLGILYAQAGLLDDAEREFEEVLKADPNHPRARDLLSDLRKRRQVGP